MAKKKKVEAEAVVTLDAKTLAKLTVAKPTLAKSKDEPLVEVIWPAQHGQSHRRAGHDFAAGEVLCFKKMSDVPTAVLMDKGFMVREAFYSHNRSDARLRPPLLPLPEGAEEKLGIGEFADDEETADETTDAPVDDAPVADEPVAEDPIE